MLIRPPWRAVAAVAALAGLAVLGAIAVVVHGGTTTAFDSYVLGVLDTRLGPTAARVSIDATIPAISVSLLVAAALGSLVCRRPDGALLCLAPLWGILLELDVLKPLIDRHETSYGIPTDSPKLLSYPSGHETGITCTALVLFVIVCQLPVGRVWKLATVPVFAAWIVLVAVGLVRNHWHYTTDTFGGIGLAAAVVVGWAFLIDGAHALLRRGRRRSVPVLGDDRRQLTPRS